MRIDYYWVLVAVINLILFLLHGQAYKSAGYSLRRSWASVTIGTGCGHALYHLPEWIYGLSTDYTSLWIGFIICMTGIVMIFLNLKLKNVSVKKEKHE